ncbi:hypothetical protein MKW92_043592 [Papaver armeniacum]|nr:hypothetical protein MKW92_043592 [Papaver armeniacum]
MAWTLISPSLKLLQRSTMSSYNYPVVTSNNYNNTQLLGSKRRVEFQVCASSSDDNKSNSKKDDTPDFNPFGFVTDNPSSRSAIQLPEIPAEDGNVGQMLYVSLLLLLHFHFWLFICTYSNCLFANSENRRQGQGEYGSFIRSGKLKWFMADAGFHCYAPDWIGFGFSDKPQPGYGFNYTGIPCWFIWINMGLEKLGKGLKLTILNSPLIVGSKVPGLFNQLRIPLLGEFTCQNAIMAERFIEGGSQYVLKSEKADVYRLPYLASSGPGFDKYLRQPEAEEFQKGNPSNVKLKLLEGAGHMPQEDWPEKVVDALKYFL